MLRPAADRTWAPHVEGIATDRLIRVIAATMRALVLPEYSAKQPGDRRPARALEAAEAWLEKRTEDARMHARAVAKACTAARRDTLGSQHRIAEAARFVATAVTRTGDAAMRAELYEALAKIEEHMLYRYSVDGVYGKEAEVRERILEELRR